MQDSTQPSSLPIDLDPSTFLLLQASEQLGLRWFQDTQDPHRIMFDATQFNRLGQYTSDKGIKGDFLARLKEKLDANNESSQTFESKWTHLRHAQAVCD